MNLRKKVLVCDLGKKSRMKDKRISDCCETNALFEEMDRIIQYKRDIRRFKRLADYRAPENIDEMVQLTERYMEAHGESITKY